MAKSILYIHLPKYDDKVEFIHQIIEYMLIDKGLISVDMLAKRSF